MITIITPCLNRASMIETAIQSVLDQDYANVEHIIMDGGSTDGTLNVLARYRHLQVYSQFDAGIYDALNKGLNHLQGDIIGFLNSDDLYEPDIFRTVIQIFDDPTLDAITGKAILFENDKKGNQVLLQTFPGMGIENQYLKIANSSKIMNAWFFRKKLVEQIGEFDLNYKIAADWDWMIRLLLRNPKILQVERVFYRYRKHPDSITFHEIFDAESVLHLEDLRIVEKYVGLLPERSELSQYLRDHQSKITISQGFSALRKGKFRYALNLFFLGLRNNRHWTDLFLQHIRKGLSRRLVGSQKSVHQAMD